MKKLVSFIIYSLTLLLTVQQNNYTLGPNLIVNPNFGTPVLPPSTNFNLIPFSIEGWNCTKFCQISSFPITMGYLGISNTYSYQQYIDLNSNAIFENVSQNINISKAGNYVL